MTSAPPASPGQGTQARVPHRVFIRRIRERLAREDFGSGPLASLRRNGPAAVMAQPAFHRVIADLPEAELDGDAPLRWATVVHALAIGARAGAERAPQRDGTGLAEAGLSEARFVRLLVSRADALRDQVVLLARYLHARDTRVAWQDLGELVLVEGRRERRADALRFRIARDYYRALGRTNAARRTPDSTTA